MDALTEKLKQEYVRHDLMAAHPSGKPEERAYHQGARDAFALMREWMDERRVEWRFVIDTEHTGPAVS